jgi:hypothetical protein
VQATLYPCGHTVKGPQDKIVGQTWMLCPTCQQLGRIEGITGVTPEPMGALVDMNWPRRVIIPAGAVSQATGDGGPRRHLPAVPGPSPPFAGARAATASVAEGSGVLDCPRAGIAQG